MIDIIRTIPENLIRIAVCIMAGALLYAASANPPQPSTYEYATFLLVAAFMLSWGMADWKIIEKEVK